MGTRKVDKWFPTETRTHTGWKKELPMYERRKLSLKAHKGNLLSAARSLQALSNVTKDKETKKIAKKDADFFYKWYADKKR
jgi:hypothetical protein